MTRTACSERVQRQKAELRPDSEAVWAVIPKCSWSGCDRVGTKWIARHVCNCDTHGSPFMLDTPWAELARKEGR